MRAAAEDLSLALDALLPQTQCRRCGYPACADYAAAMADGEAGPDRCPPGGDAVAARLADRLGAAPSAVDRSLGEVAPWRRAVIVESGCIGCTRCIAACPVDAIIGGARLMHAVVKDECTGCDLCLPACPVDCIEMRQVDEWTPLGPLDTWFTDGAPRAKARFGARRVRGDGEGIRRETRVTTSGRDAGGRSRLKPLLQEGGTRGGTANGTRRSDFSRERDAKRPFPAELAETPPKAPPGSDGAPPPSAPREQHADFVAGALARARARRAEQEER